MSANEHDDDQPDSGDVIERLHARVAKLEEALRKARAYLMSATHEDARATDTIFEIDIALKEGPKGIGSYER